MPKAAPGELPATAAERRNRERQLAVAAAEEAVELRPGAEQIEVEVAEPGERQRLRDVGIDDHPERQRADARRGTAVRRRPARRRRPAAANRTAAVAGRAFDIAIAGGGIAQDGVLRGIRGGAPGREVRRVDLVAVEHQYAVDRRPIRGSFYSWRTSDRDSTQTPGGTRANSSVCSDDTTARASRSVAPRSGPPRSRRAQSRRGRETPSALTSIGSKKTT